jgi:hypothetical protein
MNNLLLLSIVILLASLIVNASSSSTGSNTNHSSSSSSSSLIVNASSSSTGSNANHSSSSSSFLISNSSSSTGGTNNSNPTVTLTPLLSNFALLAASAITNTGATIIMGDIGLSPGVDYTDGGLTDTGTLHITDSTAATAQVDLLSAYNYVQGLVGGIDYSAYSLDIATINGGMLTPGIYKFTSSAALLGTVTFNGVGQYIFQIGSTFNPGGASNMVLADGARACDIFWGVGSSATISSSAIVVGNILAYTSITGVTSATVNGRLLALGGGGVGGAITLDSNIVDNRCGPTVLFDSSSSTGSNATQSASSTGSNATHSSSSTGSNATHSSSSTGSNATHSSSSTGSNATHSSSSSTGSNATHTSSSSSFSAAAASSTGSSIATSISSSLIPTLSSSCSSSSSSSSTGTNVTASSSNAEWYNGLSRPNQIGFIIGVAIGGLIILGGIAYFSASAAEVAYHSLSV